MIFGPDTPSEYLHSRIAGTYVRYNGDLVYVDTVQSNGSVVFRRDDGNTHSRDFKDRGFDFSSPRLGLMNVRGTVVNVERVPYRRWRQGVDTRGLRMTSITGAEIPDYRLQDLDRLVKGEYVPYSEALRQVTSGSVRASAFCREYCIARESSRDTLYRKTEAVGWINGGVLQLSPMYEHLREELQSKGVPL